MCDDSWKLHSWSSLHDLLAALLVKFSSPPAGLCIYNPGEETWESFKFQELPKTCELFISSFLRSLPPGRNDSIQGTCYAPCMCTMGILHVCMWRPEVTIRGLLQPPSTLYFREGHLAELGAHQLARLDGQQGPGIILSLPLLCWHYRLMPQCLSLMWVLGIWIQAPHVCTTNTVSTTMSVTPLLCFCLCLSSVLDKFFSQPALVIHWILFLNPFILFLILSICLPI